MLDSFDWWCLYDFSLQLGEIKAEELRVSEVNQQLEGEARMEKEIN